jgi:hypothetical protein
VLLNRENGIIDRMLYENALSKKKDLMKYNLRMNIEKKVVDAAN